MADPPAPPSGAADLATRLRALTQARVGLGRTGQALEAKDMLDFQMAHAVARDAVHAGLDVATLRAQLDGRELIEVRSRAGDRTTYLQRPDLGRQLDADSRQQLEPGKAELAIVIGDGLSAKAVEAHTVPMVKALITRLNGWTIAPMVYAHQARVAIGDAIGAALGADLAVVLIGERPGLSAADSLGAYITWQPRIGRLDSERNCVSNIRPPHGLSYAEAAAQIVWLLVEARKRRLTGVELKAEHGGPAMIYDRER